MVDKKCRNSSKCKKLLRQLDFSKSETVTKSRRKCSRLLFWSCCGTERKNPKPVVAPCKSRRVTEITVFWSIPPPCRIFQEIAP